jgi:hypothetical protein
MRFKIPEQAELQWLILTRSGRATCAGGSGAGQVKQIQTGEASASGRLTPHELPTQIALQHGHPSLSASLLVEV